MDIEDVPSEIERVVIAEKFASIMEDMRGNSSFMIDGDKYISISMEIIQDLLAHLGYSADEMGTVDVFPVTLGLRNYCELGNASILFFAHSWPGKPDYLIKIRCLVKISNLEKSGVSITFLSMPAADVSKSEFYMYADYAGVESGQSPKLAYVDSD